MPIEFNFTDVMIQTVDGTSLRWDKLVDITETFDEMPTDESENLITFSSLHEYSIDVKPFCPVSFRRLFDRIAYGWNARGPIRKRVLRKLYGIYGTEVQHKEVEHDRSGDFRRCAVYTRRF